MGREDRKNEQGGRPYSRRKGIRSVAQKEGKVGKAPVRRVSHLLNQSLPMMVAAGTGPWGMLLYGLGMSASNFAILLRES